MRVAYKVSSPNGEFADTVFNDWFQLCAHLMGNKNMGRLPLLIDIVVVMD